MAPRRTELLCKGCATICSTSLAATELNMTSPCRPWLATRLRANWEILRVPHDSGIADFLLENVHSDIFRLDLLDPIWNKLWLVLLAFTSIYIKCDRWMRWLLVGNVSLTTWRSGLYCVLCWAMRANVRHGKHFQSLSTLNVGFHSGLAPSTFSIVQLNLK